MCMHMPCAAATQPRPTPRPAPRPRPRPRPLQAPESAAGQLQEETFWFTKQAKDRLRLNLLATYPPLRRLLRSGLWPEGINFGFTLYAFPVVVALLLLGPQVRAQAHACAGTHARTRTHTSRYTHTLRTNE